MGNISIEWEQKKYSLVSIMNELTRRNLTVAFSGGADSALLVKLATDSAGIQGTKVCAVTVQTKLHPHHEMEDAKQLAEQMGADAYTETAADCASLAKELIEKQSEVAEK